MKNLYTLTLFCVMSASAVHAQQTFESKKKSKEAVNTASLQAVKISAGNGRAMAPARIQSVYQQSRNFSPAFSLSRGKGEKISYAEETGLPLFIQTPRSASSLRGVTGIEPSTASFNYLDELKESLQIADPRTSFIVQRIKMDPQGKTHVRLMQHVDGIPVYGAEVMVHLNAYGEGEAFNGRYFAVDKIQNRVVLNESEAISRAMGHIGKGKSLRRLSDMERKLVQFGDPTVSLCVYRSKALVETFVLAYHIRSSPTIHQRFEYFIDAGSGVILNHFESTCSADGARTAPANDLNGISRTINTYQKGTTFFMIDASRAMFNAGASVFPDEPVGAIMTVDMNNTFGEDASVKHVTSTNNTWTTATHTRSVSAHFNAGVAYEYYRVNHARNSIDGNGGTIISLVNVADPENGSALDNAFWNGKLMYYGNGDVAFKPLAGALDVAGHEMTHGVVENTANLEYQGQSGAINESMADIFGVMMDPADWTIGEDVVKLAAFPSGALRSLSDPHNGGTSLSNPSFQPKHTNEAYTGSQDNGGVHINSGIPNHAFFKYAEAITKDKAADVFYKALDDYLTRSSQFIDLRLAVIKAAGDLFGTSSNEVTQAGLAFDAVGIVTGQGGTYTETLPSNPGSEFFLVYNTDVSDNQTLYRLALNGSSPAALSATPFISKPSVTDDGSVAVFVGEDHKIHALNPTPGATVGEVIIQNEAIWSNVVISKGGTKLAAVTTSAEPMIYVYDFASGAWGEFELYNPTYTEGVNSAGPQYADALEWDYSGEYLVYDCFNRLDNNDGSAIEYWDVNFIHVWDMQAGDFADGTIAKLFASLPEGVSIGDPSFAKNSPNIIAFDYIEDGGGYAILGCNVETNEVDFITENNTLGWPSYNKADNHVAFTTLSSGDFITADITLNANKISSSVDAVGKFIDTKWITYFATGDREIGDEIITGIGDEAGETSVHCYPNPFTSEVTAALRDIQRGPGVVEIITPLGQRVMHSALPAMADTEVKLDLTNLPKGYYILTVKNASRSGYCRILKTE